MHYIGLDQFIESNFVVTVHGPMNPIVAPDVAMVEVRAVLARI